MKNFMYLLALTACLSLNIAADQGANPGEDETTADARRQAENEETVSRACDALVTADDGGE